MHNNTTPTLYLMSDRSVGLTLGLVILTSNNTGIRTRTAPWFHALSQLIRTRGRRLSGRRGDHFLRSLYNVRSRSLYDREEVHLCNNEFCYNFQLVLWCVCMSEFHSSSFLLTDSSP